MFEQSFLDMGFKPLLYMLNLDKLKLKSEEQVFYALKLWINHNMCPDMKKYVQQIRFSMTIFYFYTTILFFLYRSTSWSRRCLS